MPGILRQRNNLPKPVSDKTCSRAFKMRNQHKQPWPRISEVTGGREDWGMTTTKEHTCPNKIKLDYVDCSATFPNVSFLLRLCWCLMMEANSELFLGWGSWSYTRATNRRKSLLSFFQLKLVTLGNSSLYAEGQHQQQTPDSFFLSFQKFQWVYSKKASLKSLKRHQRFFEDSVERTDAEISPVS